MIGILAGFKKAALLATVPTVQSGIFQEALNREGFDFLHQDSWQIYVDHIIEKIKQGQIDEAGTLYDELHRELAEKVDTVIIACTDLNMVTDQKSSELTFVDSSACLAQAIVNKYVSLTK